MPRKLSGTIAALAFLFAALFVAVPAASAASWGDCEDNGTEHYLDGNVKRYAGPIERIQADLRIDTSSQFKPCSPDDNSGVNGPTVFIGLERPIFQTPHVQAGITRCVNAPDDIWNDGQCNGTPRFFSEYKNMMTGVSIVRDLGAASYNTTYTFMIDLDGPTQEAQVFIDGVLKTTWEVGGDLNPGDDPHAVWLVETHDKGDGLGSNVAGQSVDIGTMKYRVDGVWWFRSATCNYETPSAQVECRNNGSYSQYFFTAN